MILRLIRRPLPPLLQLAAVLSGDFVSSLIFALFYSVSHSLAWSLVVALLAGGAGIVWTRTRGRQVDHMQWMSLALVVVFGGVALLTHNARLVMLKPTLVYLAVSVAMLKPGWMRRYLPAKAQHHGRALADAFGYVWAAAMAGLALANLAFAWRGDMKLWAAFLTTAPLALKLALGVAQYGLTRRQVIIALHRERTGAEPAGEGPKTSDPVFAG